MSAGRDEARVLELLAQVRLLVFQALGRQQSRGLSSRVVMPGMGGGPGVLYHHGLDPDCAVLLMGEGLARELERLSDEVTLACGGVEEAAMEIERVRRGAKE